MSEIPAPNHVERKYGPLLLAGTGITLTLDGCLLLDGVTLQVHAGELLGVIGPNGAGKSTLLKILAGVVAADHGELLLERQPFAALPPQLRARKLAWLEQRPTVQWPLTVRQVVALGRLPHGGRMDHVARLAIANAMDGTDTAGFADRPFHTLSEGEKLRVNLARVIATGASVLLADEPVAALDPWHQLQVLELLQSLARAGMGIIVVLHDLGLAARFCDRLLLLDKGRFIASGSAEAVLSSAHLAAVYGLDAELNACDRQLIVRGRLPG
jgi:iron complex transport system ATP-binding protein